MERDSVRWAAGRAVLPVVVLAQIAGLACAPRQFVAIDAQPAPLLIFVDSERIELEGGGVELRADRPHVLYFKRDGYLAQPVILESRSGDEGPYLEPAQVRVRLRPRSSAPAQVTIEEEDPDAAPRRSP